MRARWLPLAATLFAASCGGGSTTGDTIAGHWRGAVPWSLTMDLHVDAELAPAGAPGYFMGTLRTDVPMCFTSAMLVASLTDSVLDLIVNGAGTATQNSSIRITGSIDAGNDDKIVGLFSMVSSLADCEVTETAFVFERQ